MTSDPRTGALLPVVLAAMVIIGLAASAALFVSRADRAASANAQLQTAVASAVDEAEAVARSAVARRALQMRIGESVSEPVVVSNAGVDAWSRASRLGPTTFAVAVAATARDRGGRVARRGAVVLLRLRPVRLDFPAALVLEEGGEAPPAAADGRDRPPAGWDCDSMTASVPDTMHPLRPRSDSAELAAVREGASIRFPSGAAPATPAPVVRDGECDSSASGNWGDPARPSACAAWLPVVHAAGDLRVVGGKGQGVLLVDGDLDVSGGFEFVGAVIVAGRLLIGPGGTTLTGGVRAGAVVDARATSGLGASIVRSSCALRDAALAAGTFATVADRPWAPER